MQSWRNSSLQRNSEPDPKALASARRCAIHGVAQRLNGNRCLYPTLRQPPLIAPFAPSKRHGTLCVVSILRIWRLFDLHAVPDAVFCCFFQVQGSNS
jgi:hypothetical protein